MIWIDLMHFMHEKLINEIRQPIDRSPFAMLLRAFIDEFLTQIVLQ